MNEKTPEVETCKNLQVQKFYCCGFIAMKNLITILLLHCKVLLLHCRRRIFWCKMCATYLISIFGSYIFI